MKISPAGIDLIKSFEGYHTRLPNGSCKAYLDKLAEPDIWTIGYGCTKGVYKGLIWTKEEALAGLRRELDETERGVMQLVTVELTQAQFDALVSFAYNVGLGALKRSTLLRYLNAGQKRQAQLQLTRWVYAGGNKWRGLERRRRAELAHWGKDVPVYAELESQEDEEFIEFVEDATQEPIPRKAQCTPPEEIDTHKELAATSRKYKAANAVKGVAGAGVALGTVKEALSMANIEGTKAYIDAAAGFVTSYGMLVFVAACVGGYIIVNELQKWMAEDMESGRYVPSGDGDD